jgi:hypothetical protein
VTADEPQQCKACKVARPGLWICPAGSEDDHRWPLNVARGALAGEGPPPSRRARTSLGFGLLGSWAPPAGRWHSDTFRLATPDGRSIYITSEGPI